MWFRIKICGVTRVEDAVAVVNAGADAVGLNFYPGSSRCVSVSRAAEIQREIEGQATIVGVFVNATTDTILRVLEDVALDGVQLHGDEPIDVVEGLVGHHVIRAFRLGANHGPTIDTYLRECRDRHCPPRAILVDAHVPGEYGGTGQIADWEQLEKRPGQLAHFPLVLAGGLKAENVSQAIRQVRPQAVDTASGVEVAPGIKDPSAIGRFVNHAQRAFAEIEPCGSEG